MRKCILLIFACSALTLSFGQNTFKKNDIYVEALGNGLYGSVNYERQLTKEPGLGARIGVGFYSENAFYLTLPVGINYLFPLKNQNSFIDAGLGVTLTSLDGKLLTKKDEYNKDWINFIPSIGYRRHTENNVMWRISLTPVINKNTFVPWIGASIGKRF